MDQSVAQEVRSCGICGGQGGNWSRFSQGNLAACVCPRSANGAISFSHSNVHWYVVSILTTSLSNNLEEGSVQWPYATHCSARFSVCTTH
jgi:hypothetical protein